MFCSKRNKVALTALALFVGFALIKTPLPPADAADHAESTSVAGDPEPILLMCSPFLIRTTTPK